MKTGEKLIRYDWDMFPIRQTRCFMHRYKHSIVVSLRSFVKARNLDWQFEIRTDPVKLAPGQRANTIWVTRIEPVTAEEPSISGVSDIEDGGLSGSHFTQMDGKRFQDPKPAARSPKLSKRPLFFDVADIPIQARLDYWEKWNTRKRMSRNGWDRFNVGDYEAVPIRLVDIISQLRSALLSRNLVYRFEIRRIQNPNDGEDRAPWYLVSRVR